MDEKIIRGIVIKVFEEAKKTSASHTKYALSKKISSELGLSSKTLERAYDRYINRKESIHPLQGESIKRLCTYLGYEDYGDYVTKNLKREESDEGIKFPHIEERQKSWLKISVVIVLGSILLIIGVADLFKKPEVADDEKNCMTWADSHYLEISCDIGPFSTYGTKVEPLRPMLLKNMKRIEVGRAYKFFSKDDKPLIWYYKTYNKEIEYYTAPGLHPINGETLKKITPYMIQTYGPLHNN